LRLRTITSGLEKITASVAKSGISYNETIKYYNASFTLTATQANALVVGQFYKA
jgi:hypothetical protein